MVGVLVTVIGIREEPIADLPPLSLPALSAAGKDLGVWSIASNLPAVLAPWREAC